MRHGAGTSPGRTLGGLLQQILHETAGAAEVHLAGILGFQRPHHLGPHAHAIDLPAGELIHRRFVQADQRAKRAADQMQFIKINIDLARTWPLITKTKAPLPDADEWKDVKEKLHLLKR